jgi:hypothetical protein
MTKTLGQLRKSGEGKKDQAAVALRRSEYFGIYKHPHDSVRVPRHAVENA